MLILWRKKAVPANFYAFCISELLFCKKKLFFVKKILEKMKEPGDDSSLEIVLKNVRNFQGIIFVNLREL